MSKLTDFLGGIGGGSGIGGMPIQIVRSDTLLSPNFSYGIDTSQGVVDVTLPASPIPGDRISFFDAALTWDKHPCRVFVNGNTVEMLTNGLVQYDLNERGGVHELLFINEGVGWKDISLYKSGVNPAWTGGMVGSQYRVIDTEYAYALFERDKVLKEKITDSKTFEVTQSGYYCLIAAGGSGGHSYSGGTKGGNTEFKLGSVNLLTSYGSIGTSHNDGSNKPYRKEAKASGMPFFEGFSGKDSVFITVEWEPTLTRYLDDALRIGIDQTIYDTKATGFDPYSTQGVSASSKIAYIPAGSTLQVAIGARGIPTHETNPKYGNSGKAAIYFLGEHHDL